MAALLSIEDDVAADGARCLVVRGELDLDSAPELESRIAAVSAEVDELVLDLRELAFLDSTGLRLLLSAARDAEDAGRRLRILRPAAEHVRRVLEVSGVADTLPLE